MEEIIQRNYDDLGSVTFAEVTVSVLFLALVCLWFFRSPGFMDGWSQYFESGFLTDTAPTFLVLVLLFCIPMNIYIPTSYGSTKPVPTLLTWSDVNEKFPWGIIFLIGGGFCIAEAAQESGLSDSIGESLAELGDLPNFVMVAIICFVAAMITEITSNSATCTVLMPVMASLAESLGRNPLYLMIPVAISTSYAFMLPVATPPNAIVFQHGRIKMADMLKAGALLNVICVAGLTLATETWGVALFDFDEIPWANANVTMTTESP